MSGGFRLRRNRPMLPRSPDGICAMPFVVVFIVAIAAFIGWQALQPVCPGGAVIASAAACRENFDAAFCLGALPEMQRVAARSGDTFKTQSACLDQWPVCIERSDVSAWAPRPASYCVVRAPDGAIARIEPIYARREAGGGVVSY